MENDTNILELKKKRNAQLSQWRTQNILGFSTYKTEIDVSGKKISLEQVQCKDGIYIIQEVLESGEFLIFKTTLDFCIKV